MNRIVIYSKRNKKNMSKTISKKTMTQEEIQKELEEYKKIVEDDNIKYVEERNQMKKDNFIETKKPHLISNEDKSEALEKISVDDIIQKLDHNTGNSMFIIGSSRSGKTYMLKKILEVWMEQDPLIIPIFFIGNRGAPIYKEIKNDFPFFDGLKASLVETLKIINTAIEKPYKFLIILDDILNVRYSDVVQNLALSYRNSMFSSIFLLQNATLIFKNARNNASVYLFSGNTKYREALFLQKEYLQYLDFFRPVKNMGDKIKLFQNVCKNYGFIAYFPLINESEIFLTNAEDKNL